MRLALKMEIPFSVLLQADHEGVPWHGHDEAGHREQQEVEGGTLQVHGPQREGRQDLEEGCQGIGDRFNAAVVLF